MRWPWRTRTTTGRGSMTDTTPVSTGLHALLERLIDYAGLFPPAGLEMADAVEAFERHRTSAGAFALGRFVVPASRLDELERAVTAGRGRARSNGSWPLTVLGSQPLSTLAAVVERFNDGHADGRAPWTARVESLEVKAATAADIARASAGVPANVEVFFEVPLDGPFDDVCQAAAASGRFLKFRTGGTSVDTFPPSAAIARALAACASSRVPFKATAGLHHPVRSAHAVTGEPGAPAAMMHGFLNVFVAAALLAAGRADAAVATQVLEDELRGSFAFDAEGLSWRGLRMDVTEIRSARRLARSFGSCSFDDPLREL
jgi:hypothetical protein